MDNLVIFDADCMLCNRFINFLLRHDHQKQFWFTSNDSIHARQIIIDHDLKLPRYNTIIFVTGNKVYTQSDAILYIFRKLGGIWQLGIALRVLPKPFRDYLYSLVARSRYTIFGKTTVCQIGTAKDNPRLI